MLIDWRNRVWSDIHCALSRSQIVKGSFQTTCVWWGGRSHPGFHPSNKPASHACCPQPDQVTDQSRTCAAEQLSSSNVVTRVRQQGSTRTVCYSNFKPRASSLGSSSPTKLDLGFQWWGHKRAVIVRSFRHGDPDGPEAAKYLNSWR